MIPETSSSAAPVLAGTTPRGKIGRYRWLICLLLFIITTNAYMDRQVFSIAAPVISAQYKLSNSDIAAIANAFVLAYGFGQLFAGIFVDRIGARNGLSLAVLCWSVTAMLIPLARSVSSFGIFQFLLGASESVSYPGGVKASAEWFPPKELATAVGLFQSGSSTGMLVAAPVSAFLIVHFGWQAAFLIVGIPGLLWIPFWLLFYHPLRVSPQVGEAERAYILSNSSTETAAERRGKISWWFLLRQRTVLSLALARFCEEPSGWFYWTWIPIYLKNYRHISLINVGFLLTIPFLTFDIGKIGGGWASSHLMKRGWSLDGARKAVILGSALCLLSSIPAIFAGSTLCFILLIGVATFGHGCWSTATHTIPGDIIDPRWVGSVFGITALGGALGGVVFMHITGKLVDLTGSFNAPLIIAGLAPMIGCLLFLVLVRRLEPLRLPDWRG